MLVYLILILSPFCVSDFSDFPLSPKVRGTGLFFLDAAIVLDLDDLLHLVILHGVTTNPTLLERVEVPCIVSLLQSLFDKALSDTGEFMCQSRGGATMNLCMNVGLH